MESGCGEVVGSWDSSQGDGWEACGDVLSLAVLSGSGLKVNRRQGLSAAHKTLCIL